jgi:Ca2+-binding EF-hand superfamily protein
MKLSRFALGLVALIALQTGSALADDDDSWGWHMWGWQRGSDMPMMGRNMMMGGRFGVIDANNDGVISADEGASQREAVFAAMDSDDDGELTEAEFMAVSFGPGPGWNEDREEAMQAKKKERFAAMDPDKNGKVTQAEFMAEQQKRFASADTDKDGKVTPWEFRAMRWQ